ncbi:YlxR family protein [Pajaroellobacter abortibovis]|uniref:YlxR family protein n=1 Tax=Pajaroellobacter abortibovis TaxID=1882918 RepID=UPI00155FFED3|nr:YlxR family protein [Pajaroellobacter abortibovis]
MKRRCVGCLKDSSRDDLLRVVQSMGETNFSPISVDFKGGTCGRGAYLHLHARCLSMACRGGFSRAFRSPITVEREQFMLMLEEARDRRMESLLRAGYRAKRVVVGSDASERAIQKGAPLTILAWDAGKSVMKGAVENEIRQGRVLSWKDKASLGALFDREQISVMTVTKDSFAYPLHRTFMAVEVVREDRASRFKEKDVKSFGGSISVDE